MAKKPKTDPGEASEEGKEKGKGSFLANRKLLIMVGVGVAVLLGGGVGAVMMMGGDDGSGVSVAAPETKVIAYYYDLPVMIVNLAAVDNRTAYVKLEVALELSEEAMVEVLHPNLPRVLDAFQTYLRELRPSDLSGSAGLFRLKEELQRRINLAVYPARVEDVLFKNVIVQ